MWKDFFYFTKAERRGVIVLAVLVVVMFIVNLFPTSVPATDTQEAQAKGADANLERKRQEFEASLKKKYPGQRGFAPKQKPAVRLATFDPNTADSATFLSLGLPPWMAKNILRYRAKKGRFRRPEDFRKIYGLTDTQYQTLLPYIQIVEQEPPRRDTVSLLADSPAVLPQPVFKYSPGTLVDLNRADTTELKKIPGIGSAIAARIVSYRECLGGYYDIGQLQDIRLKAELLRPWFILNEADIRRLRLNHAGVERLARHPYINFYQARVIVEHRKKKGELNDISQLSLYEEFSAEDLERIGHYIDYQ
ncbi:MAG: helix-hairpin-helix domain-containing protein [Mediterranea sp.]|jgi:DNA uptake protein ComE-like DNA-binding protein|nr:helix-hairpin-helix domain-containing protein [Mediterranea sp.]